jgi:acylphosphatase
MYTRAQARQLGVSGYVRNLRNRDVEIVAAGEASKVDALLKWAESGSPEAVVNNLEEDFLKRLFKADHECSLFVLDRAYIYF